MGFLFFMFFGDFFFLVGGKRQCRFGWNTLLQFVKESRHIFVTGASKKDKAGKIGKFEQNGKEACRVTRLMLKFCLDKKQSPRWL